MIGIEHVQKQINMADIYNPFYAKYVSDLVSMVSNEEVLFLMILINKYSQYFRKTNYRH